MISSILYLIALSDLLLMGFFFVIGWWAIEKEHKECWKDEETMEVKKSNRLANKWSKTHPILDFFQGFYYELKRKKDIPEDTYRNIKWFIQRGKRGYSDCDVWGFYSYLTKIITTGLKDLLTQVHGAPGGFLNSHSIDLEGESDQTKEWKKIIEEMIWTFEALQKIEDHDWIPCWEESKRKECEDYVTRLNKPEKEPLFPCLLPHTWHLMTEEEMKKYHEGWKLFKDYFTDLWD